MMSKHKTMVRFYVYSCVLLLILLTFWGITNRWDFSIKSWSRRQISDRNMYRLYLHLYMLHIEDQLEAYYGSTKDRYLHETEVLKSQTIPYFQDGWGRPFWVAVDFDNDGAVKVYNVEADARFIMWSSGKNGVNEWGLGDDIVYDTGYSYWNVTHPQAGYGIKH